MQDKTYTDQKSLSWHYSSFLLLCCCALLCYGNTYSNGWHFDDFSNILYNNTLHISTLHPKSLVQTFFAHPAVSGQLFRPIANLSFGLNWFIGQDQPAGYHFVNIAIHCLTAIFLYLSCFLILRTPALAKINLKDHASIALLAAIFWAMSPIQTQAVTYLVQRMAQLAALFSIITIFFFLLARLTKRSKKRILYFSCCVGSALFALGSKENSILLPFTILLLEYIFFFQQKSFWGKIKNNKKTFIIILGLVFIGMSIILWCYHSAIFNYSTRNFTLTQRLLTEPRILLFYLRQIFLPDNSILSIEHDTIISTSLFTPRTTLVAIVTCMGLIILSIFRAPKAPLFSFAILFFFLNHLIESTIIPLELVFEHRNYLPSLFLFLPVSNYVVKVLNANSGHRVKLKKSIIILGCTAFLILSGYITIKRNGAWANEQTLWEDAVAKAPKSGRAKLILAGEYLKNHQYDKAKKLCKEAEDLEGATKNEIAAITLNAEAAIEYYKGNLDNAYRLVKDSLAIKNTYAEVGYNAIHLLIKLTRYNDAFIMANNLYQQTKNKQTHTHSGSIITPSAQSTGKKFAEIPFCQ